VVNMSEVAARAGVSSASVSYAYNRPHKLSYEQRERILRIADEMGYHGPDPNAASLRTGRVGAIGLMITDSLPYAFTDPATYLLLQGIADVGELAEVALTFLPFAPAKDTAISERAQARNQGKLAMTVHVDGFLVYALPDRHPVLEAALARLLPTVIIDAPRIAGVPFVGITDSDAAESAARYALKLGHRNFGVLTDRLKPDGRRGRATVERQLAAVDGVPRTRLSGYAAVLNDADIDWTETPVIEAGGFSQADYDRAASHLLDDPTITAVLATSDVLGLAAMNVARDRGIDVPGQVTIIGFDNIPAAREAGLTTIAQPHQEKGRAATRMLLEVMKGGEPVDQILPTRLVVGTSSAPPPLERRYRARS
jgi:DNA-binding LacI/PurR family transcriptional regulator